MGKLFNREKENCEFLRDALHELTVAGNAPRNVEEWRAELPEAAARHLDACESCREALDEFAETRGALAGIIAPEPGPWFTARVMAAIGAEEREEEARDGVWVNVRKLAPRLVALSALLLALGGSWAVQQNGRDLSYASKQSGDMVFDSSVSPAPYDDALGSMSEVRP